MPNHVISRLAISGPPERIEAFRAAVAPTGCLDFETIIPMPEILRGSSSGSDVDTGLAVLGQDPDRLATVLTFPHIRAEGIATAEELRAWVEEEHPDWLEFGRNAIRLTAQTGYRDWYNWANANWDTKWNGYRGKWTHEPGSSEATLTFQTAWDAPRPVFRALASRPEVEELVIDVLAVGECGCFAYCARIDAGGFIGQEVELTPELYDQLHGEPEGLHGAGGGSAPRPG